VAHLGWTQHHSEEDAVVSAHPKEPLLEALTPSLAGAGFDLEDVEVASAGRRRVVRVLVDKDGGITLDDISDATRIVSEVLDASEVLGEAPYTLEVTSPGVDRPLTLPRHWRRNADRLVKVTPHQGAPITGRISGADETAATLDVDGSTVQLAYADVARARIEIEFNRGSAPGKKKRGRAGKAGTPVAAAPPGQHDDETAGSGDDEEE
jgi:ribosome maturation factor RimP